MTDKTSVAKAGADPGAGQAEPETSDVARFLQDWTQLWRREMQAQSTDPAAMPAAMFARLVNGAATPDMSAMLEMWRAAAVNWANAAAVPPAAMDAFREFSTAPRPTSAAAAPDPRDAEIGRLARRVDELEARLAELEKPRRRRG